MAVKFKTGDRVRFLNETGGGIVTEINDKGIIFVQTEDGFEIPVSPGDLIPAGGFTEGILAGEIEEVPKNVTQRSSEGSGKKEKAISKTAFEGKLPRDIPAGATADILVAFVADPVRPVFSGDINLFLVNDSEFAIYYLTGMVNQGNYFYLGSGLLEAGTKIHLKTFAHTELSKISDIHLQVLFVNEGKYIPRDPLDILVDIAKVNFSKESYFRTNDYFDQKAVIFGGQNDKPDPQKPENTEITPEVKTDGVSRKQQNDTVQVDLHIENLVEKPGNMSPGDIVNIQIKKFHEAMEDAVSRKAKRLIIVHGVGQGTLKLQIRKELQEKYPYYSFQDASFREYGFGATLVHLHIIKKQ
jgi:hypothetical protein